MYDSETLEALLKCELIGLFEMLFIDGETRRIDIRHDVHSTSGVPMYFVTENGTVYIWERVISIKKVK